MSSRIISLTEWFQTPPGRYLLDWEQSQFDAVVDNLFGYNALQLGLPELECLQTNRMPHRWLALLEEHLDRTSGGSMIETPRTLPEALAGEAPLNARLFENSPRLALVTDAAALPFPPASLDLLVLPHTLELSANPHHVLREVERVLVPDGRVVISGFNPRSLWGLRQTRARVATRMGLKVSGLDRLFLPEAGDFIGTGRLLDWLHLLSFEVESERFGCYRPAVNTESWLQRFAWMDRSGPRWWPILGSVYFLVAIKRVRGVRLLGPAWKPRWSARAAPVSVASRR